VLTGDFRQVLADPDISIIIELIGGYSPDREYLLEAIENGKHVITANKALLALHGQELYDSAARNGVEIRYEAAVAGGIPVLSAIKGNMEANRFGSVLGILNGTCNYILTRMTEEGAGFAAVLKSAQELGYAEADPTFDVEGYDARGKVCILANVVMGVPLNFNDIACKGITGITLGDIEKAKKEGKRWKLIGCVEKKGNKVVGSVNPEMVELSHPLAGVMGAKNALTFTTDMLGDLTIIGPGAGKTETGFSILTDMLAIHRGC